MNFSNRLKELRSERDLRQEDLGQYLNIGRTAIANYENGRSEPSYDLVIKLADLFDVTTDYILGRSNIKNPYISMNQDELNKIASNSGSSMTIRDTEEIEVINAWRSLDYEDKIIIKGKLFELKKYRNEIKEKDLSQKKAT